MGTKRTVRQRVAAYFNQINPLMAIRGQVDYERQKYRLAELTSAFASLHPVVAAMAAATTATLIGMRAKRDEPSKGCQLQNP